MGSNRTNRKSLFRRLLSSSAGNTLALGAAAIVPLAGMIGGGLDMSRAYLVKTRVQQACDAATLAARKKLAGGTVANGEIPTEIEQHAQNFFDANFVDGSYGTNDLTFTLTAGNDTRMDGTASVDMPMALMQVFGFDEMDIDVTCSAELNLPNVDVMLVLDQSGSMNTGTRMQDLRDAVFAFYDTIEASKPPGARIRIGVVPYSGAVNVGRILVDENPDWIADSWQYQTREAVFNEVVTWVEGDGGGDDGDDEDGSCENGLLVCRVQEGTAPRGNRIEGRTRFSVPYDPQDWANRDWWGDRFTKRVSGSSPLRWRTNNNADDNRCNDADNNTMGGEYIVDDEVWVVDSDNFEGSWFNNGNGSWRAACRLRIERFELDESDDDDGDNDNLVPVVSYVFSHYRHFESTMDTSVFKTFADVQTPTGTQGTMQTSSWNGCIEERKTVAATNFDPIPAGAYDLDINLVPDPADPDTQWKAQWSQITYARQDRNNQQQAEYTTTDDRGTHSFNCPSEARRLQEYPSSGGARNSDFENYINGLSPTGGTMHDMGMIWGGRFLTANGLFTSDNATAPNGDPISRHIIFMTDGEMGADPRNYVAYGNVNMDGRFMGFKGSGNWSEAETAAVNNERLEAICRVIKNENITVWSITFELAQNDYTRKCASGTSRAFEANGAAELADAFRKIASSIAELRLVN